MEISKRYKSGFFFLIMRAGCSCQPAHCWPGSCLQETKAQAVALGGRSQIAWVQIPGLHLLAGTLDAGLNLFVPQFPR